MLSTNRLTHLLMQQTPTSQHHIPRHVALVILPSCAYPVTPPLMAMTDDCGNVHIPIQIELVTLPLIGFQIGLEIDS